MTPHTHARVPHPQYSKQNCESRCEWRGGSYWAGSGVKSESIAVTAAAASVRAVASSSTHDNGRSPPVSIPPVAGCMRGEQGDYSGATRDPRATVFYKAKVVLRLGIGLSGKLSCYCHPDYVLDLIYNTS